MTTAGRGGGPYPSFQTNVNRTKTKRWVEAKSFSYDGDEWGDDEEYDEPEPQPQPQSQHAPPPSIGGPGGRPYPQYGGPPRPGHGPPPGRGPPMQPRGRPSFDRDDRQPFPPHQGSFEGPYPTAQRSPFGPPPDHSRYSPAPDPRIGRPRQGSQPRPLGYDAYPHAPFMPDSRGGPYPPQARGGRRSESGHRPSPSEIYGRRESPGRPMPHPMHSNRTSRDTSPSSRFPPRKSSLGQQQGPVEPFLPGTTSASTRSETPEESKDSSVPKPLPFIRPADIYKRMEEEKEKQRRQSQDSSRRSMDSPKLSAAPIPPPAMLSGDRDSLESPRRSLEQHDSSERVLRPKPTLDPVTERKSEYGFDKMLENAPENHPSAGRAQVAEPTPLAEPLSAASEQGLTYASSQYSDRPDPVSANSVKSKQSFGRGAPESFHVPTRRELVEDDQQTPRPAEGFQKSNSPPTTSGLQHQTSLGYRSLVNQAFEDSEKRVPPTPSSNSDSMLRTGSASTSDISPILSRNSSSAAQHAGQGGQRDAPPPTIPEETAHMGSRPPSSDAAKSTDIEKSDRPLTPPPTVRPGYRRHASTPSPKNSPARRPISVETGDIPRSELATLATVSPGNSRKDTETFSKELNLPDTQQLSAPPEAANAFIERNESPIPRSQSPSKGKVRDLTERFNESGNSSPSGSPQKQSSRPSNARLESFRPALPGSWMSYTTNEGFLTPSRTESDFDSVGREASSVSAGQDAEPSKTPTKKEIDSLSITPENTGKGPRANPFVPAATASSAFAGATSTLSSPHNRARSESEGRVSEHGAPADIQFQGTSAFASDSDMPDDQEAPVSAAASIPPTPLPKDTEASAMKNSSGDYFPPPIRTNEPTSSTPMRPQMLPALSTGLSPEETENDRLQKAILKDLTPRTANKERGSIDNAPKTPTQRTPTHRDQLEGTMAPKEYNNYWDDLSQSPDLALKDPSSQVDGRDRSKIPAAKDLPPIPQSQRQPKPPRQVKKRFSWESSSSEDNYNVPTVAPLTPHSPQHPRLERPDTAKSLETTKDIVPRLEDSTQPLPSQSEERQLDTGQLSLEDRRPSEADTFGSSENSHLQTDLSPSVPLQTPKDSFGTANPDQGLTPPPAPQKDAVNSPALATKPDLESRVSSHRDASADVMSYREISALKTPHDRISAYNLARDQYVNVDTGLSIWLQATGQMLPEHADVVVRNGRLSQQQTAHLGHKLSPSRSKFPRIVSLTGAIQPSQGGSSNAPSPAAEPASGGIHQMQEDGKKLLQSAGKLGGRAGGAAKGLILKGKSKFRHSGGGEKARSKSQSRIVDPPHSSLAATTAQPFAAVHENQRTANVRSRSDTQRSSTQPERDLFTPSVPRPISQSEPSQGPRVVVTGVSNSPPPRTTRAPKNFDEVSALGSQDGDTVPSRSISEVTQPRKSQEDRSDGEVREGTLVAADSETVPGKILPSETLKAERTSIMDDVSYGTHSDAEEANITGSKWQNGTTKENISDLSVNVGQRQKAVIASVSKPPAMVNIPSRVGNNQVHPDVSHTKANDANQTQGETPHEASTQFKPSPADSGYGRSSYRTEDDLEAAQPATADRPPSAVADISALQNPRSTPPTAHVAIPTDESDKLQEIDQRKTPSLLGSERSQDPSAALQNQISHHASPKQASRVEQRDTDTIQQSHPLEPSETFPPHQEPLPIKSQDTSPKSFSPTPQGQVPVTAASQGESFPDRRQRQSYSRPFKEPDITTHPAYRESPENIDRRSQVYASEEPPQESHYEPSYRPTIEHSDTARDDNLYRIPGPYGQQYRSPRQQAFPPSGFSPTAPEMRAQNRSVAADVQKTQRFDENGNAISHTQHGPRPRSHDRSYVPRPISTEYEIPGIGPPPPEPSPPKQRPRSGIFSRARSRSRPPLLNDDASDTVENLFHDEHPKERRSSLFSKRTSKQTSISTNPPQVPSPQNPRKSTTMPSEQPEKNKKSNKLQRSSTSGITEGETKRKSGFSRWSGIFSRSKSTNKASPTPETQALRSPSRIDEHGYYASYGPQRQTSPTLPDLSQMQTQTLPPLPHSKQGRGYYAVYSSQEQNDPQRRSSSSQPTSRSEYLPHHNRPPRPDTEGFVGGRQLSEQQVANEKHNFESETGFRGPYHTQPGPKRSPPNLRINTESNKHRQVPSQSSSYQPATQAYTAPPGGPSRHSPYAATSPSQTSPYGYGSARGLNSTSLSHTIDLQKRSRSPRGGRRNSLEDDGPYQGPAQGLGTFSNRSSMRKSGDGEQEAPWRIDLPHEPENRNGAKVERSGESVKRKSTGQASGSENDAVTRGRHRDSGPFQRIDAAAGDEGHIAGQHKAEGRAELQGSRVPGDESEDDVIMSSTAYPGQEWMPAGYGWDD